MIFFSNRGQILRKQLLTKISFDLDKFDVLQIVYKFNFEGNDAEV